MSQREQKWKDDFVNTFIATWCATNHTDYCMRGLQKELENPPIEDAIHLAHEAWELVIREGIS